MLKCFYDKKKKVGTKQTGIKEIEDLRYSLMLAFYYSIKNFSIQ